ncbi:hypothetical protein [Dechloromonas sp. A34]|uniref:hypothetical protein n=1 Tax=Dechloromonas sp. A34 TaxID=447588 RepID=UPI0022488535|nr:hypothetical protein [Dechloromonas sp. A34]
MAISISVPPIGFSTVAPVAFPLLSSPTPIVVSTTTSPATASSFSSLVDLSITGQLLSAVATTENQLSAPQTTDPATPESAQAAAQRLVASFNALQDNVAGLQTLFVTAPDALPAAPLSPTLNEVAATALTAASSDFDSLLGIGIQTAPSPTTGAPLLSIDQQILDAASTADPVGTQGLLDQAIDALSAQLNSFESQAADASLAEARLAQVAATTTAALDQNTLFELTPAAPVATLDELLAATPTTPPGTTTAATTAPETAVPTNTVVPAAAPAPSAAAADASADTQAADRRASAATIALQNLLANSVTRSADLQLDPVYAALIASVRLSDFVAPTPLIDPAKLAAEFPEAVSPTARVRAVEERV